MIEPNESSNDILEIGGQNYRPSTLTSVAARQLADLQSILDDLNRVVTRCDYLEEANVPLDTREAVWESILVTYCRCFTIGKSGKHPRRRLTDSDLRELSDGLRSTHRLVRRERNSHVAHRDDPRGEASVVMALQGEGAGGIRVLAVHLARRVSPLADPRDVRDLAAHLITLQQAVYDDEADKLLDSLR